MKIWDKKGNLVLLFRDEEKPRRIRESKKSADGAKKSFARVLKWLMCLGETIISCWPFSLIFGREISFLLGLYLRFQEDEVQNCFNNVLLINCESDVHNLQKHKMYPERDA